MLRLWPSYLLLVNYPLLPCLWIMVFYYCHPYLFSGVHLYEHLGSTLQTLLFHHLENGNSYMLRTGLLWGLKEKLSKEADSQSVGVFTSLDHPSSLTAPTPTPTPHPRPSSPLCSTDYVVFCLLAFWSFLLNCRVFWRLNSVCQFLFSQGTNHE